MRYRATGLLPGSRARIWRSCLLTVTLTACVNDPVDWGDVSYRGTQLGDPDARSAVVSASLAVVADGVAHCLRSIHTAGAGSDLFRAWWTSRSDSSVVLSMQHSTDRGSSWQPPVEVETRDRGHRGCDRPPPGIFYDPTRGYVHLVYFIEASNGAGVFFAHSMDKGGMFHSPVPVVYGKTPSAASVAASGDSVVVVFEDPNATAPHIGMVLSSTTGHIFEQRGEATPDDVPAIRPWVSLDHQKVTVWWRSADANGTPVDRVGYRIGVWR